jgi:hypothetical protein
MQNEIKVGDTVWLKEYSIVGDFEFRQVIPANTPLTVKDVMIDNSYLVSAHGFKWWAYRGDFSTTPLTPIISDVQSEVGNG